MSDLIAQIVPALLGGGLVGSAVTVYTARKKVPAEVDSVIVNGAESAVGSLERSLTAETRRADRAEARVLELEVTIARKDARIEALERRLDGLQTALDEARAELHRIITNEV